MRISDWSSDVCSSDLIRRWRSNWRTPGANKDRGCGRSSPLCWRRSGEGSDMSAYSTASNNRDGCPDDDHLLLDRQIVECASLGPVGRSLTAVRVFHLATVFWLMRSEEHTSDPQSLM